MNAYKFGLRSPAGRVRNHAFTLTELLTVIAIIGVLAAILIPTVGTVRESAKRSACASNLRQVGLALNAYVADHRYALPGYEKITDNTGTYFDLGRKGAGAYWWFEKGVPTRSLISQLLPYTSATLPTGDKSGVSSLMICPAYSDSSVTSPRTSYYLSIRVVSNDGKLVRPFANIITGKSPVITNTRSMKYTDIFKPSRAVALFDVDTEILTRLGEGDVDGSATSVHNQSRNVLYFDGHVASVSKEIDPHETL